MLAILWLMGIVTLIFGVLLLFPGSVVKISNAINKTILTIDHEQKLKTGSVVALLFISAYAFFLIYYYSR